MAQLWSDIKITTCEGRPCWVNGRRAIFHRWTDSARPVRQNVTTEDGVEHFQKYSVHGLVEYEDGTMAREWHNVIRFADSWEYFQRFDWEAMERRRDAKAAATPEEIADDAAPEISAYCDKCANGDPILWAEHCAVNGYSCTDCKAPGCICKDCAGGDKWKPEEGTE